MQLYYRFASGKGGLAVAVGEGRRKSSCRFAISRINTLKNKGLQFPMPMPDSCGNLTSLVVVYAVQIEPLDHSGNRECVLVLEL